MLVPLVVSGVWCQWERRASGWWGGRQGHASTRRAMATACWIQSVYYRPTSNAVSDILPWEEEVERGRVLVPPVVTGVWFQWGEWCSSGWQESGWTKIRPGTQPARRERWPPQAGYSPGNPDPPVTLPLTVYLRKERQGSLVLYYLCLILMRRAMAITCWIQSVYHRLTCNAVADSLP